MKKLRYVIETALLKALAFVAPRLPRHGVMFFAKLLGAVAFAFDVRGRELATENLRVAFAGQFNWWHRQRIACATYQNFARTFIDLFWARAMTAESWAEHFEFEFEDPTAERDLTASGSIWVTAHFGNFELSSLVWGYRGMAFTIVAQDFKNPALTDIFKAAREVSGHHIIPQQSALLRLSKSLSRGGHAAFLSDLTIRPGRAATVIDAFGLKTCVTTLHVLLSQRLKLPIVPALMIPLEDGRYRMKVFKAQSTEGRDAQEVAQQCWSLFEAEVRERPHCWMWMYKHWRYLPAPSDREHYPFYANPHKGFAKLMAALAS